MPDNCTFEINPLAQATPIQTPSLTNLDYTCQEFWSLKSRMRDNIKEKFADIFNDFIESDIAIMLLENWAFIADLLSFKMDQIANEIYIDTVTEVENAFRLSRLVGFRPQPPIAAQSRWTSTIGATLDTDLRIPSGLQVSVVSQSQPIIIELYPADSNWEPLFDEDIIISAGSLTNSAIVGIEGLTISDSFSGTGEVGQSIKLNSSPVVWDSVSVTINGVKWEEIEYFTDSQRRLEYRVEYDSEYNAFVLFGNNLAGMIPPRNSEIQVTYRRGGGTAGNIVTGSVTTQRTVNVDGFNFGVPVSFRNYTQGMNGYAGDTIEEIRRKLPAYLRTQGRAVSGGDYKTIADQFATSFHGMIGKATAVLRNYGCAANIIDLYILARNGDNGLIPASNELKVALQNHFDEVKMLTDYVCMRDGVVVPVEISIDIVMDKFYRKFEDQNKALIQRRVNQFFSLNNWEYGQILKDNDLIKSLADVSNVKNFEISFITGDSSEQLSVVSPRFFEIIRPDSVTINFFYE